MPQRWFTRNASTDRLTGRKPRLHEAQNSVGHVTEMTGHVPEFGGHDAETVGHDAPKYAIYRRLPFPTQPILDWFHISMRVRYLEQIAGGLMARSDTEPPKFGDSLGQLDYRLREFFEYLQNNRGTTINYGKLHRCGRPISTAMAESAVNQVLNHRMCKRQQMRWTPRGAHLLAQVRCAVINGDLTAKLRERKAQSAEPIPENIARSLEELQRVAA